MSYVKKEIMRQEIAHHISALTNFLITMRTNINTFFYDILDNFSVSIWITFFSDLIQYIHILYYPFSENVSFYLIILIVFIS